MSVAGIAISGGAWRPYHSAVVCSDGTWMAPSDVHVQTAGAWKEGEMARDPGARCVGYRRAASNGADREAELKAPTLPAQTPHQIG
jgi:hypothetical protein